MWAKVCVMLALVCGCTACVPVEWLMPSMRLMQPVRLIQQSAHATPTPQAPTQPPLAHDWNMATQLIINNPRGVWLRTEPSHLSLDTKGMPIAPHGSRARILSKPEYEPIPGQWWWLVSVRDVGIGWVEQTSLSLATPDD